MFHGANPRNLIISDDDKHGTDVGYPCEPGSGERKSVQKLPLMEAMVTWLIH